MQEGRKREDGEKRKKEEGWSGRKLGHGTCSGLWLVWLVVSHMWLNGYFGMGFNPSFIPSTLLALPPTPRSEKGIRWVWLMDPHLSVLYYLHTLLP